MITQALNEQLAPLHTKNLAEKQNIEQTAHLINNARFSLRAAIEARQNIRRLEEHYDCLNEALAQCAVLDKEDDMAIPDESEIL